MVREKTGEMPTTAEKQADAGMSITAVLEEPEQGPAEEKLFHSAPIKLGLAASPNQPPFNSGSRNKTTAFFQKAYGNLSTLRHFNYPIQAKMKVSQPDDIHEQEADRIAEQVITMSDETVGKGEGTVLGKHTRPPIYTSSCREEDENKQGELVKDMVLSKQITPSIRRKDGGLRPSETNGGLPEITSQVETCIRSLQGSGLPLPESVRSYLEPRFGCEFGGVRVHTGPDAAEVASAVNAKAFTLGQDIVFAEREYSPETSNGQRLLAHELTHVIQQKSTGLSSEPMIRRNGNATPSNLQKLDELLDRTNVPEDEVIALLDRLTLPEKTAVLAGSYSAKIVNALNVKEMVRAITSLNPELAVKLQWVEAASTVRSQIDYSDIRGMIIAAPQPERDALKTIRWRNFFVDVCTNETIFNAVDDLGFDLATKLDWIRVEMSAALELSYSDIKSLISGASQAERDTLKSIAWRDFFVDVCDNAEIKQAVNDLGFDLKTKLEWMVAEGTNTELVREVVAAASLAEVQAVRSDPVLSALLAKEVGDTDVPAERLSREILSYIKTQAATRAAAPPSIDPSSRFYNVLKDKYLKDYLAAPSPHEGKKAVELIGKPMETRKSPTDPNIIEVRPEGGAWRPAENRWEKGAELFWNKQKVPELPSELRDLSIFQNIKTLPRELAAGTGMLIREKLTELPYIDVPFLLGVPNTSTATLVVDVVRGGKNLSQLMHWATGVKYSSESPKALRELFLAYEKWHLEGWDVFGQDALNDLIAEEQGRLLGTELQKGAAGEIKSETDLLPFLNRSFLQARAWIGALLRLRRAELDAWILSKEQKPAKMHWGALPEAQLWPRRTIYQMLVDGESLPDVQSSFLVVAQIEIYTLLFEADRWEAVHGPIMLTNLEKALVAGDLDAILSWTAKGGGFSGAGEASEEKRKLKGNS